MNGTNRGPIRAYAVFSNDFIDLVVKDYSLDLFDDPFPFLEEKPDPVWAGHPVGSRDAANLMSALLSIIECRFDRNPNAMAAPHAKNSP